MANDESRNVLKLATPPRADVTKATARGSRRRKAPADTEDYYTRIESYAHQIRKTRDIGDIIGILDQALGQTRALHTADEVAMARRQVVTAEQRIENLKKELELVRKLVCEDQLTGALNRRGLDDALAREAARAERADTPMCVSLIDIDDFKAINDQHGHQVGDVVLVHLVAIIKETIRGNDLIGRYGGEEFLLLLPDSRIDEATAVTARLQRRLAGKPVTWGNQQLLVRFSAGVSLRRPGESDFEFIHRADLALYEAKRVGKDRIIVAP